MMAENEKTPLLVVKDLKKWFSGQSGAFARKKSHIKAVDGVSFSLDAGESLGIVGESGCGKSTMGRSVLRLLEPSGGQIIYKGKDFTKMKSKELRKARSEMQIIFQDPYASLNPRMTIGEIISEPLNIQLKLSKEETRKRVLKTMEVVGLNPKYYNRYPHEFSGGQRQRIGIARSIVLEPKLIVCDEPVSALDVSIQAWPTSSSLMTSPLSAIFPTAWASCTWVTWWKSAARRTCSRILSTPTPELCSPQFPFPSATSRERRSFSKAIFRLPQIPLPVAFSIPAAIWHRRSAARKCPSSAILETVTAAHAISVASRQMNNIYILKENQS